MPIRRSCLLTAVLVAPLLLPACSRTGEQEARRQWSRESNPYLFAATEVATWIRANAVDTEHGPAWLDDAETPGASTPWLSTGAAGITLFFLELAQATEEDAYLADARRGAAYLAASLPDSIAAADLDGSPCRAGLYDGWAGVGFALSEAAFALDDSTLRVAAARCVSLVKDAARQHGDTVHWGNSSDILNGDAGTALYLLYAANRMGDTGALALAEGAGRGALGRALADSLGRLTWTMREGSDAILPNFSHGAAGIGYFLATLSVETRNDAYLTAALAAGDYLRAVARTDSNTVFLVPYGWPNPEWEGLYDIGWAHGPAGTGRFLHRLARLTGDPEWSASLAQTVHGIRVSGLPGAPESGFGGEPFKWDTRFGQAGAAAHVLKVYEETGEDADLEYAKALVDDLLAKGVRDGRGLRWTFPRYAFLERPGEPAAFTGYFYGAAGFGLLLIQLDSVMEGIGWDLAFPDDPFGGDLSF